ncbi:unnamed protein product [Alopecurus aequalis]
MPMAAGNRTMEQGRSSPSTVDWSNLPDDLLGMIRSRVAYQCGRVRFAAVCRLWRAVASQHLAPPAIPLLVLSLHVWSKGEKHLYCPVEGRVLHVPVPTNLRNTRICGTYDGGWIAAIATPATATLTIVNLFTSVEVTLSGKQMNMASRGDRRSRQLIRKIIFSEVPTSSGCILAALTTEHQNVALCRVGCPDGGWTIHRGCDTDELTDAVFHRGEFYGLTHSEKLIKFEIGVNKDGAPVVTDAHTLDVQWRGGPKTEKWFTTYIFELRGKLAVAVMTRWLQNHEPFFKVFELTATTKEALHYEWKGVPTLADCALFLGQRCSSRVVHVQAGGHGVVEKNHIYFSNYRSIASKEYQEFNEEAYLATSEDGEHIYCQKDPKSDGDGDDKERIPSVRYYSTSHAETPMWCFPPDF